MFADVNSFDQHNEIAAWDLLKQTKKEADFRKTLDILCCVFIVFKPILPLGFGENTIHFQQYSHRDRETDTRTRVLQGMERY